MFWRTYGGRRRPVWREFDRLQREMNRLMDDMLQVSAPGFPAINVWADEECALVVAEIPGVAPDDIEISVVGETLTLSGSRPTDVDGDEVQYHRRERWQGEFSRTLEMPFRINANDVEATFSKGILQVKLPRADADKPKKISVKAAAS